MDQKPQVGVAVFVIKDNKILLGKRKGSHGADTWALPGGHLEFGENWAECATREVKEETGLEIFNPRFITATNDIFKKENKHYVTLFMYSELIYSVEPILKEPDKCSKWEWFDWYNLPEPLFLPVENLLIENLYPQCLNLSSTNKKTII